LSEVSCVAYSLLKVCFPVGIDNDFLAIPRRQAHISFYLWDIVFTILSKVSENNLGRFSIVARRVSGLKIYNLPQIGESKRVDSLGRDWELNHLRIYPDDDIIGVLEKRR
jgi:hypothetical protein